MALNDGGPRRSRRGRGRAHCASVGSTALRRRAWDSRCTAQDRGARRCSQSVGARCTPRGGSTTLQPSAKRRGWHWSATAGTTRQPATWEPRRTGSASQHRAAARDRVGVALHCASVGRTTLHPGRRIRDALREQGRTTLQPKSVGVAVHCATVGRTALQPASVGFAMHCVRRGRTTPQPARSVSPCTARASAAPRCSRRASDLHALREGRTLQPARVAPHCASVGTRCSQ